MKLLKLLKSFNQKRDDDLVRSIIHNVRMSKTLHIEEDRKSRMDITNYCFIYNISYDKVEICVSMKSIKSNFFGMYVSTYTLVVDNVEMHTRSKLIKKLFNIVKENREKLFLG